MLYKKDENNKIIFCFNPEQGQNYVELFLYYLLNRIQIGNSNLDVYKVQLAIQKSILDATQHYVESTGKTIMTELVDFKYLNDKVEATLKINDNIVEVVI